jgi:hypothetical protein
MLVGVAQTGELSVRAAVPEWNPDKHFVVNVLTYLKKIFYMKDFPAEHAANPEAMQL